MSRPGRAVTIARVARPRVRRSSPDAGRTAKRWWALVLLLLVASAARAELLLGRGDPRSECYVAVDVTSADPQRTVAVNRRRTRVRMDACGQSCAFGLKLCTNVATPRCTTQPLRGILVTGNTDHMLTRPPPDDPRSLPIERCASGYDRVTLTAGERRRIQLSARIHLTLRAVDSPMRDDDSFVLECRRSTRPCCGDGVVTSDEECDYGDRDSSAPRCDPNCRRPACGNGFVAPDERCDDGNTIDGDGCDSNCTPTGCGNGIVDPTEECEPHPLGMPSDPTCDPTDCRRIPDPPCECVAPDQSPLPSRNLLRFDWTPTSSRFCGSVVDGSENPVGLLACDTLYYGGGPPTANDLENGLVLLKPATITTTATCVNKELRLGLGSLKNSFACTSPGCLLGRPFDYLSAVGPACLVMTIAGEVHGRLDCITWDAIQMDIPLDVEIFLHPDISVPTPEACPRCPGFGRAGCSTEGLIRAGSFHIPIASIAAPVARRTAGLASGGDFCGYCSQASGCFKGDPDPSCGMPGNGLGVSCTSDAACSADHPVCKQSSPGAFGKMNARHIDLNTAIGGNLGDNQPHPADLGGVVCVPPTFLPLCLDAPCPPGIPLEVDSIASLPGPAAFVLTGQLQLLPLPLSTSAPTMTP